ncbi:MAG: hypothetical protein ACRELF_12370, partial [Gemmataceae bacterium]
MEQLASKVDSLTPVLQKVDDMMIDMRQLSADRHTLAQAANRVDVQLAVVVKQLEELRQDMREFAAFKTTGENIIGWIKWFFGGSLAAGVTLLVALIASIVVGGEIRSSVKGQGQRIDKLEEATVKLQESTAKLQEATSSNAMATRTLVENLKMNTEATTQMMADMRKELKALSPVKVDFAKTHEVT